MADFVVLLRALGPGNTMPMADLRTMCGEIGLERPETYIQSGNLLVGASSGAKEVEAMLESAIKQRFGLSIDVIARPAEQWRLYQATNPFAGDPAAIPKMVHIALSKQPPKEGAVDLLRQRAAHGERIYQEGDALWIDYGENGAGRTKLSPSLINRAAGSPVTARNWNTVRKLQDMIEARSA